MANDSLKVRITADDRQFVSAMTRVQTFSEKAASKIGAVGAGVSALGFAMGETTGQIGQAISALGNMASIIGTGGLFGAAIFGVTASVSKLWEEMQKADQIEKEIRDAFLGISTSVLKDVTESLQEARRELKNFGKSALEIRQEDAKAQQVFAMSRIRTLNALMAEEKRKGDIEALVAEGYARKTLESGRIDIERLTVKRELTDQERKLSAALEVTSKKLHESIGLQRTLNKLEQETAKAEAEKEAQREAERKAAEAERRRKAAARKRKREAEREAEEDQKRRRQTLLDAAALGMDLADKQRELDRKAAEDEAAWELEFSEDTFAAEWALEQQMQQERLDNLNEYWNLRNNLLDAEEVRLTELGQTQVYWQEQGLAIAQIGFDQAVSALRTQGEIWGELQAARERGDKERAAELERAQRDQLSLALASIAEELSNRAIGEGTIIAAKGAAAVALGQPGGFPALAIGTGLIATGLAGTFGAAAYSGYVSASGAGGGADTGAAETRAPTTAIGVGVADTGSRTTVVNYYFGGPVFGNADDAARTVTAMNARGLALEGRGFGS